MPLLPLILDQKNFISVIIKVETDDSDIRYFANSNDVVENRTKYGHNASCGSVLWLHPGSQVYADLDILKPANYAFGLRANNRGNCSSLTVAIEDEDNNSIIILTPSH